jgi:hypothetical protein
MGVAQLVRRAIVMSLDLRATAEVASGSDRQTSAQAMAKLTSRLPQPHADALILNAGVLGLSYGEYVARLVNGSRLPQPIAERQADRAALLASNAPGDRTPSHMDRCGELTVGDEPIDRRAAEAGGLHDRGQPGEQAYRLGRAMCKEGGAVHA